MEVRAVVAGAAGESVPLHDALEALALADAGDLDLVAGGEDVHGDLLRRRQDRSPPDLDEVASWERRPAFFRWPSRGLLSRLALTSPYAIWVAA